MPDKEGRGRLKISLKKPNFKQYVKLFKIIFFTLTSTVNISRLKTATVNVKEIKHSVTCHSEERKPTPKK